jgi:uracil-DNA glycosylase family 4
MTEDRAAQLAAIAQQIRECTACRLYKSARNAVPGYGDVNADILFIGEGPGVEEDRQGIPFVGRSGRYLDYLLDLIGMKREQVFITNVIKHRAPDNRDPQSDEIIACKAFLDKQFAIIDPLVVVTLGRFSMARYFPNAKISRIHGHPRYDGERAYYPLYHPAAALRNPGLRRDMEADIKRIPQVVEEVRRRREGMEVPDDRAEEDEADDETPRQLSLF